MQQTQDLSQLDKTALINNEKYQEALLSTHYGPVIVFKEKTWYYQGTVAGRYRYTC